MQLCFRRPRDRAFCQLLCWSEAILGVAERRIEHQALTLSLLQLPLYFYVALSVYLSVDATVYLWHYLASAVTFVMRGQRRRHDFAPESIMGVASDQQTTFLVSSDEETFFNCFLVPPMRTHFLVFFLNLFFAHPAMRRQFLKCILRNNFRAGFPAIVNQGFTRFALPNPSLTNLPFKTRMYTYNV